jgi:hypothetical protein
MSGYADGRPDMTRRKNDRLPVAAANELRQGLAGARRHKLVKTRKDVEQWTDDAPEVDQLAADREIAAHERSYSVELEVVSSCPARQLSYMS